MFNEDKTSIVTLNYTIWVGKIMHMNGKDKDKDEYQPHTKKNNEKIIKFPIWNGQIIVWHKIFLT